MTKSKSANWDLSKLHHTLKLNESTALMDQINEKATLFSTTYKSTIHTLTALELYNAIKNYEAIKSELYQISQFAHLNYAVNFKDQDILKFVTRIDEFTSTISNILLFFFLEVGNSPNDIYSEWLTNTHLKDYNYAISQAVTKNIYRLSEKEEQLINLKDLTGSEALRKLYSEHTSRYSFKITVDGEKKVLNDSECRSLRYHPDQKIRHKAMDLFYQRYKDDEHIIGNIFNSIIKDYNIERKVRGYHKPISPMNVANDLPDDLIDMLHDITTESNHLVQRYYRLKKKHLGLNTMTLADIYAPMSSDKQHFDWDTAKNIVLDSFNAFDKDFADYSRDVFNKKHIDVFPSKQKRGGAFCSSSHPKLSPYVMLNYLGKQRDISTLAHELGHAIHAYFSSDQPLINYHAILPICETASVFSEMLVIDALKKKAQTPQEKIVILSSKLEDIFATSHRQNMFSRFEQQIHNKITDTRLSSDELCDIYKNELTLMFGKSVKITENYHWEWSTIPHMLDVPFYVYSYNFGNLLVLGLYQQYLNEGKSFIPKLKRLLSKGSSISPLHMFSDEGINLLSNSFWEKSISFIDSILTELEDCIGKI